jgi:hypothetical protein
MRSNNVILFIVLAVLSASNAFEFTNLAAVKELRASAYGNNLIETISLSLASQGNVDEVVKLLGDLKDQLLTDQRNADAAWEKVSEILKAEIEKIKTEIMKLKALIADLYKQKAEKEALIKKATENLVQYKNQKDADEKSLVDLKKKRDNDEAEAKKSEEDHIDVSNAIKSVLDELKKLIGKVNGVRPDHIGANEFEKRDDDYKKTLKAQFLQISKNEEEANILVELATNADQAALAKLLQLLEKLLDSTNKSQKDDAGHEAKSIEDYTNLTTLLKNDINSLDNSIKTQEEHKQQYENELKSLITEIKNQEGLLKTEEESLVLKEKEFHDKETIYLSEKAQRVDELKVISKLEEIVTERLSKMSGFLKAQTNSF